MIEKYGTMSEQAKILSSDAEILAAMIKNSATLGICEDELALIIEHLKLTLELIAVLSKRLALNHLSNNVENPTGSA